MTGPEQDTQRRHGLEVVPPPQPQATPLPPHAQHVEDVPWWTPTWQDSVRYLGWRWIFALPAVIVAGLLIASFFHGNLLLPFYMLGSKVVTVSLAIPIVLLLEMWRKAISSRQEPFCIHCGYDLSGLPDHHRCPECGRPYSFAVINEYRRDPHWFKQRYKTIGHLPEADQPFQAGTGKTSDDGT